MVARPEDRTANARSYASSFGGDATSPQRSIRRNFFPAFRADPETFQPLKFKLALRAGTLLSPPFEQPRLTLRIGPPGSLARAKRPLWEAIVAELVSINDNNMVPWRTVMVLLLSGSLRRLQSPITGVSLSEFPYSAGILSEGCPHRKSYISIQIALAG